jgi:hypothetical protein
MTRAGTKIRQDGHQIASTTCQHRNTAPNATQHDCKLPPLVYKRRRWPPSRESKDTDTTIHPSALTHAPDIGTCLNNLVGTWGSLLLSHLVCSPPLRAPQFIAIQSNEREPAGRTDHSQNQDKTRVPLLLSTGHRVTDLNISTS